MLAAFFATGFESLECFADERACVMWMLVGLPERWNNSSGAVGLTARDEACEKHQHMDPERLGQCAIRPRSYSIMGPEHQHSLSWEASDCQDPESGGAESMAGAVRWVDCT